MKRPIIITPTGGADEIAMVIFEELFGRAAPEDMSADDALGEIGQDTPDLERRLRHCGAIIHELLASSIRDAVRLTAEHLQGKDADDEGPPPRTTH